jgi:hypothetical protein
VHLRLAVLQLLSVTVFAEAYSGRLFYILNSFYFVFGFFSLNWRQGLKNISFVTLPVVILMVLILLFIAVLNGQINDVMATIKIAFMLWGLILTVGLPIFVFRFIFRILICVFRNAVCLCTWPLAIITPVI